MSLTMRERVLQALANEPMLEDDLQRALGLNPSKPNPTPSTMLRVGLIRALPDGRLDLPKEARRQLEAARTRLDQPLPERTPTE